MTVSALQRAIVPVVVLDDDRGAEPLADALMRGGITSAEITFRTPAAPSAIRRIAARPDFLVGAGTVITADQVDAAVDAGARPPCGVCDRRQLDGRQGGYQRWPVRPDHPGVPRRCDGP